MPSPSPLTSQSQKNLSLSPSVSDLGLGDQLVQQLQDMNEERKKKALNQSPSPSGGASILGQGSGQALSPAVMSLLGTAGGYG